LQIKPDETYKQCKRVLFIRKKSLIHCGVKMQLVNEIYDHILQAHKIIRKYIHWTPLDRSRTFSEMANCQLYLKLENLQKTGSFKARGATYKISQLSDEEKRRGVVAASAGNHAQGVAYAAKVFGVKATIFMPIYAPLSKILATKSYGAEVVLHGLIVDDAVSKALEFAREKKRIFIHPYDDPLIIAGQGTIGMEIAHDLPDVDVVIVPIGGGGLISGIAVALKKKLGNRVKIIGVQSKSFPYMYEKIKGITIKDKPKYTIADGIAVKKPGKLTSQLISTLVDDIVVVDDDEISEAIFLLLERAKTVAEGAGAASLAAVLSGKVDVKNKKCVVVISGGNINPTILMKIIGRELVEKKRLVRLKITMPDRPGALKDALTILASARINIVDLSTTRFEPHVLPAESEVEIVAEVAEETLLQATINDLKKKGFDVIVV